MGHVCQGGQGQSPARQAAIFAGELHIFIIYIKLIGRNNKLPVISVNKNINSPGS